MMQLCWADWREELLQLRWEIRAQLAKVPGLYFPLVRLTQPSFKRDRTVSQNTEIVIEAYPRSGNTFAEAAFRFSNGSRLRIAHHLHAPAQVLRGAALRIPTLVILREPGEAAVSWTIFQPRVSLRQALRNYVHFYEPLWAVRDAIVMVPFQTLITDFSSAMARVNARFGTHFHGYEPTEENQRAIFAMVDELDRRHHGGAEEVNTLTVARPSEERAAAKQALLHRLESREMQPTFRSALRTYEKFRATIPN